MTVSKLLTLSGHRLTWCRTSDLSIKCFALNGQLTKSLSGWFLRHFKRWCWKRLALILCTSSNGQIINSSGSQRDHSSGADQAIYATEGKNKRQHFIEVEDVPKENSWVSLGSAEQGIRRLIKPKILLRRYLVPPLGFNVQKIDISYKSSLKLWLESTTCKVRVPKKLKTEDILKDKKHPF